MSYVKINDELYLSNFINTFYEVSPQREQVNHILIYDRSGSMYNLLHDVVEDMIGHINTIPFGDSISIGWFSSEGNYRFILKGFVIKDSESYINIASLLRKNNTTINLTCFSNILIDATEVISETRDVLPGKFNLMFFTDGYPVVSNYQNEIANIMIALGRLAMEVSSSIFVGYGGYYNKELMSKMVNKVGGVLVHSSRLTDFTEAMKSFVNANTSRSNAIYIAYNEADVFCIDLNNNVVSVPFSAGYVSIPQNIKEFYVLTCGYEGKPTHPDSMLPGLYASAMIMSQQLKSDVALDIMQLIGDVHIVKLVSNAWTNADYGKAESAMLDGVRGFGFKEGVKLGAIVPSNTFCLVDLIDLFQSDSDAFFLPYVTGWEYKRIGSKRKTREGYPKFTHSNEVKCAFTDFTWNSTRLNLSILAKINGSIELSDDCSKFGFAKTYPTWVWRNYAIVKDGVLNMDGIYAQLSKETYDKLYKEGVVTQSPYDLNMVYWIDLTSIPLVNRSIATGNISAKKYCEYLWLEKLYEAEMKYLKYKLTQYEPEKAVSEAFTNEQNEYLKSQGVTANGFSPPTDEEEATDYYYATEFDVKIAGYSSLPKIDDVLDKCKSGKKLTDSQAMVKSVIDSIDIDIAQGNNPVPTIKNLINGAKKRLKTVRHTTQMSRFAILLSKKWFEDLDTRDGATLELSGHNFTFSIRDIKVEY